ncbi:MAG: hypothetical protein PHW69_09875 [Elusimicrobiaceae bacterium]|nr:hypothetical protein [Elusimicrobiaceae bacterium]
MNITKRLRNLAAAAAFLIAGGAVCPAAEFCGKPLLDHFYKAAAARETPAAELKAISDGNLRALQERLAPLSAEEKSLVRKIAANPPYKVHRLKFQYLPTVLELGKLLSRAEAEELELVAKPLHTPAREDRLFGAYNCVFVAVGSPLGRDAYGDVVVYLKDGVDYGGWATPWSGYYFLGRNKFKLLLDKPAAFTRGVYQEQGWPRAYALMAVSALRAMPEQNRRNVLYRLLGESRSGLWEMFDSERLGYLEAKYDRHVSLEQVRMIYVPDGQYAEVLRWPQAQRWRAIIAPAGAMPQ